MKGKLIQKIVGVALGLTMAIGVGVAVGSKDAIETKAAGSGDWVQVTALSGLNTTDTYVIANNADKGYYMNGTVSSGHFQSTAFSASAPSSATAAGAFKLEAVNAGNNIYKIKLVSTSKYVYASKASSGGGKVDGTSDTYGWKFVLDGTNFNAIYQQAYSSKYASLRCYNSTSWRTYTAQSQTSASTTGTVFRLYKYQTATLSSISVKTSPKTSYVQGDYFDPTGLVITRTYSDSTSNDYAYAGHTSEFTFSPTTSTSLTTSHTSVTITYGGKSTSLAISVATPKTPASLATTGQTASFETGDTFTYGGTSTVTYTDSTSKSVTPSSFKIGNAGINPISAGTVIVPGTTVLNRNDHHGKTVYVLYEENSTTVYASYTISVAAVSKISFVGGTDTGTASGQGQSDTLTKTGVSMSCDSCYTTSGAYRFYSGSTLTIYSTVGNIAKIEFNMNGSYNSNLFSTSTGTYNHDDSSKGVWTGDAASIAFDLSAQARCDSVDITLASNDPLVELAPASSTEVSMLKGDSDTSVKVLVKNIDTKTWSFTYDEDDLTGLTTSSYINVTAGAADDNVHTLTITTKATGTTTLNISVSGTACATSIPVTVNPKPASMTIVHAEIVEGHLEIETGKYKQVSFSGEDTDGNAYTIAAADVDGSITSGDSYVTLSGTRITGTAVGTAVVRYTLKALTSVYAEVTVDVRDDYKTTVNSITFNSNLTAKQGDTVNTSEVFATKVANTHFKTTADIDDSELLFSYDNNRASAIEHEMFSYDFTHGTVVDTTHKSQTIYVFVTFDEDYEGTNFTIVVEQKNDPLTAIALTNEEIVDDEVDIARGGSLQLTWLLTPENPTDTRELQFSVDDQEEGVDISVNQTGLITIGATSGLGSATILVEAKYKTSVYTNLMVNVTLESMTYTVREEESWRIVTDPSSLAEGDQIIITDVDSTVGMLAYESGNNIKTSSVTESDGTLTDIGDAAPLTLSSAGNKKFYLYDGEYYLYAASSSGNQLKGKASTDATNGAWVFTYESNHMSIVASGSSNRNVMQYNAGNNPPIFSCYSSASQTDLQVYKKNGGDVQKNVTEALFNAVHNNFGENKTYEWSESCSTFQSGKWATAGSAITGLSGYANLKLNRAVANADGNEIEQFLAKYDFVVGKFGTTHDFLGRFAEGGINYKGANTLTPSGLFLGENASSAILIVSIINISALGGYFFLRKRKEER